ncbi:nucleotide exchange factor GrpE [Patescibacteria group bacterium]|nr:nucleotide exchange factor GrpE [Patescibacteria group bacterium]MBU1062800.1 nucleotide exchange factor GrpE [Patescibacteria group bacterium]
MFDKKKSSEEKIKQGIYKHYKGGKYRVLYSGHNSENKEEVVVYQSIADDKIWVRLKKMFLSQVEKDEKKINRFEYVSNLENDSFEEKYKRALADYQNLLKQSAKEKMEFARFANERLLYEILPVYDNLKTSIQYIDEESKKNGWVVGIEYIIKQFSDVLKSLGIEEIITNKEKFNHDLMDAIDSEETDNKKEDGLVAKEVKSGYKLNGKIIVPAKVVVYKLK